ncbi:hypothetical protein FALBO_5183 [Fusarium albosuccineum]|uniref:Uncharacterized protein n=1 Tax=Fusarium albosuccineum TaxID=1237068 RepID=A0A8H4LI76_9HYPO|nr:hypothetical protein FALBO_5183 [Fusarium albosuccineum]
MPFWTGQQPLAWSATRANNRDARVPTPTPTPTPLSLFSIEAVSSASQAKRAQVAQPSGQSLVLHEGNGVAAWSESGCGVWDKAEDDIRVKSLSVFTFQRAAFRAPPPSPPECEVCNSDGARLLVCSSAPVPETAAQWNFG